MRRNVSSRSPYEDVVGCSWAVRPVATMVQVTAFAHPDHLVEVEVDAHRAPQGWRGRLGA